ncbi:hypothetical protein EB796_012750 [Bugula neritina]|uniref:Uncharacterized protein n=1 Tax=Bugula neritina TaxID=10212 RepID=A0A7J7JRF5_BUGNE|nr:hypothetical protein EB796_012750 [Bugula neritina]
MKNVLLLSRHGAHLTMDSMELGVELNKAAARNDVDLLKAFAAAGASMTVADYSSKTPLEIVKCSLSSVLCKGINLICCH